MSSFQRLAAVTAASANLIVQLRELNELRERVRKAELARPPRVDCRKRNAHSAASAVAKSIRKSSIGFPDLSCAVSQRGFFPRPVQVSEGCSGFRNFGKTVG